MFSNFSEIRKKLTFPLFLTSHLLNREIAALRVELFNVNETLFTYSQYKAEHSEMSISTLKTRSRISSFQSHASRRDREFLPFGLMLRDEIENFRLHSHKMSLFNRTLCNEGESESGF